MGWAIFIALAGLVAGGLWWAVRPSRAFLQLVGTALMIAAAGYAWQGRPGYAGHPVTPAQARPTPDSAFADERKEWMETVGHDAQLLDAADTLIRNGDADYAVGILRGELSREPRSMMLWMGLGNALVHHADGSVTPAARYAFERAAALAPGHPAPGYFLGLAYALSGDLDSADAIWRRLLATAAPDAAWRRPVAIRLALLDRLRQPH